MIILTKKLSTLSNPTHRIHSLTSLRSVMGIHLLKTLCLYCYFLYFPISAKHNKRYKEWMWVLQPVQQCVASFPKLSMPISCVLSLHSFMMLLLIMVTCLHISLPYYTYFKYSRTEVHPAFYLPYLTWLPL